MKRAALIVGVSLAVAGCAQFDQQFGRQEAALSKPIAASEIEWSRKSGRNTVSGLATMKAGGEQHTCAGQSANLIPDSAYARAQTICTAGGFDGARANFAPPPQTGCPPIQDPLRDRAAPPVGACTAIPSSANSKRDTSGNLVDQSATLDPGTYCGGLYITKNASVTLRAGIYVMKDGPLIVDKNAVMTGTDVAFYFTGNKGGLLFDKKTTVSLSAPTTGPMPGLLVLD